VAVRIRAVLRPRLLAARVDIKQLLSESRRLAALLTSGGLNFLLNEQPDKAIEAFIEVVKVAPETVGAALRPGQSVPRRGETERAIACTRTCSSVRPRRGAAPARHVELGETT